MAYFVIVSDLCITHLPIYLFRHCTSCMSSAWQFLPSSLCFFSCDSFSASFSRHSSNLSSASLRRLVRKWNIDSLCWHTLPWSHSSKVIWCQIQDKFKLSEIVKLRSLCYHSFVRSEFKWPQIQNVPRVYAEKGLKSLKPNLYLNYNTYDLYMNGCRGNGCRGTIKAQKTRVSFHPKHLQYAPNVGVKRTFQGWNIHLFVISSITSTAKTHISGVLVHPQACKNLNIGGENSMKFQMKFQFWGYFTLLFGLMLWPRITW